MKDGRLPKDILYGQLTSGARPVGCPALRFKDACNRDMKACDISPKCWEAVAEDRTAWRQATHRSIERADEKKHQHAAEKRMRLKQKAALPPLSRFNKICHPSQRPRWQVDKEAIGLSRVQQCSPTYNLPS